MAKVCAFFMLNNKYRAKYVIMKKSIYFAVIALITVLSVGLVSCGSDEEEVTTYTLKWNRSVMYDSGHPIMDVVLCEYTANNDRIKNNVITKIEEGKSYTFAASKGAAKIKVYYSIKSAGIRWIQLVYLLKNEGNIDIEITESSISKADEP